MLDWGVLPLVVPQQQQWQQQQLQPGDNVNGGVGEGPLVEGVQAANQRPGGLFVPPRNWPRASRPCRASKGAVSAGNAVGCRHSSGEWWVVGDG